MTFSESTNNLFSALAKFQAECPAVHKDAEVSVSKGGQFKYKFKYATFGNILKTVKPYLEKNELAVIQNVGEAGVQSILTHSSGQWAQTDYLPILLARVEDGESVNSKEQETGSSITYKKRYQLSALLFQDADFDDDGNTADGNEPTFTQRPEPEQQAKPSTNGKKKETPKPEKPKAPSQQKEESTPDDSDFDKFLADVTDKNDLIKRWGEMCKPPNDPAEMRQKYQQKVMEKMSEL